MTNDMRTLAALAIVVSSAVCLIGAFVTADWRLLVVPLVGYYVLRYA